MSLFGGVANYGGKQPDNSQGIKQFVQGPSGQASWVYKRLPNGLQVQTPADKIRPVYINTDLYVNGSIYNPSDIILKKNIEPISSEKITNFNNLEPVQYSFKNDNKNIVHYIELIPFLVQKLNDNAKEIELLKFKIQELSDNGK